ncbi:MAG: hypothetical protein L0Z07_06025 [Planctomycetes bacterium]|nr:hypothetical protein [Planctomycetota bacterium]
MIYTLENMPVELELALRERAAAERKSLNAAILDALSRGLGIDPQPLKRRDLSDVAGKGLIDARMEAVFEEQRSIDPEMWK